MKLLLYLTLAGLGAIIGMLLASQVIIAEIQASVPAHNFVTGGVSDIQPLEPAGLTVVPLEPQHSLVHLQANSSNTGAAQPTLYMRAGYTAGLQDINGSDAFQPAIGYNGLTWSLN